MTPPVRPLTRRTFECLMCAREIAASSTTSPHPEAPELVSFESTLPFVGIVLNDRTGAAELLVVCSKACADRLLAEE